MALDKIIGTSISSVSKLQNVAKGGIASVMGQTLAVPFPNTYALDYDGVDEYVDCQAGLNANFDLTDSFSFSAWVKFDTGSADQAIISNFKATPNLLGFEFRITSSDKARLILAQTNAIWIYQDSSALSTGTWYYIAATYDGSNTTGGLNVYVNGSLDNDTSGSSSTITTITTTESVKIGKYVSGNFFDGNLDEISIYSAELSAAQVLSLYNSGSPTDLSSFEVTPLVWYRNGDSAEALYFNSIWQIPNEMKVGNFSQYSFSFDGVDDYIEVAGASSGPLYDIGTGDFTVSIWAAMGSASTYSQMLFNWSSSGLQFFRNNNGKFSTHIGDSSVHDSSYAIPSDGSWHHYFVTRNSGDCDMYVDGVSVITQFTETGSLATAKPTRIGARDDGTNTWIGTIDEVAIWDSDQSEILSTIYNGGTPGNLSALSPVAWYRNGDGATWDGSNWEVPNAMNPGTDDGASVNMQEDSRVENTP